MFVAELRFNSVRGHTTDAQSSAVYSLLAAYYKRGLTTGGDGPVARGQRAFTATVRTPERVSLQARYHNEWVRRALAELKSSGLSAPALTLQGQDADERLACRCTRRPFLVLFTTLIHQSPPIRCGACFGPVPLYRLASTNDEGTMEDLLGWASEYRSVDDLFVDARAAERWAHRQLSKHDSGLSKAGLEVATALQRANRIPVYYYLFRYFGRSLAHEEARRCPSCGRAWRRRTPLHGLFDFQCRRCRLIGNIASNITPRA